MRLKKVQLCCIIDKVTFHCPRWLLKGRLLFPMKGVYKQPFDVDEKLSKLGSTQDILWAAVREGHTLALNMTENDPPASRGIAVWGKVTRRLREKLGPLGWVRSDQQRYSTTVHRKGNWGIAVSAGNWCTGLEDQTPATSAEKGTSMKSAVGANQAHFSHIDPAWDTFIVETNSGQVNATWVLLYYIDKDTYEVRAELSLPIAVSDGHITQWSQRYILTPPEDLSDVGPPVFPLEPDFADDEIDIPVEIKI